MQRLESRQLLSSVVVNTFSDTSTTATTLRAAIAIANASTTPTTITFSPTVFSAFGAIVVLNGVLELTNVKEPTTIIGPASGVLVNAGDTSGVFKIDSNVVASISNLTVNGGSGTAVAPSNIKEGGGIFNAGNVTLINVTISASTAVQGGGFANDGGAPQYGYYPNEGTAKLIDCTISNNSATGAGGGIYNANNSGLTLINSTINGNIASSTNGVGGGLANQNGAVAKLINDTITGNSASVFNNELQPQIAGGGIYNAFATISIGNTIVAGNTTTSLEPDIGVFSGDSVGSLGNNFVGDGDASGASTQFAAVSSDQVGTGASLINPKLTAMANNGGLNLTELPLAGSPVIDKGSNALVPTGITTDERGAARIAGTAVDIGAVETQPPTTIVVNSLGDSSTVVGSTVSLRAAIAIANSNTIPTTITFDPTVFATHQTITLTGGQAIDIQNFTQETTIIGPAVGVTINASGDSGIFNDNGSALAISNLTLTDALGPAIYSANAGTLLLTNLTITGDTGDGIDASNGLSMTDCTVADNTGTGISISDGAAPVATLTNVTVTGNGSAGNGSPGVSVVGNATLENVTITGSGTYGLFHINNLNQSTLTTVTLGNTVIAGNYVGALNTGDYPIQIGTDVYSSNSANPGSTPFISQGNNFIGSVVTATAGGWVSSDRVGTPNSPLNPLLGALANNGGLTPTQLPLAGSPLVNTGNNALIPAGITTDQRGVPRVFGSSVDIGAVELQSNPQLTGIPIGTAGSWDGNTTIQNVFDGNLSTYFDPPAGSNLTAWVGLDLGENATITQIKFAPRPGYEFRMLGGQFQISSTPDFSSNVQTIYTVTTTPTAGVLTTINLNPTTGDRYVRYVGGTQYVNIAEMQVFGLEIAPSPSVVPFNASLADPAIGTPNSWNAHTTINAAFDSNINTFFDPANGSLTNWVGLDLGTPQIVTQISFAPRAGYEFRMVGGQFQVSSTADFSSDVHTVFTVTAAPVAGQLTTVNFEPAGPYRYIRYTGGAQWVNIAEFQPAGLLAPVTLTGTAIGAGGSWNPYTTYSAALDGNTSTFFDPANGNLTNWVGLDLGSAQTITQIKYVARAGDESRMVGAQIQVSSTADFSSDVHTIYTVTTTPTTGQVVTVSVSPVTYRYIRYVGGTQWVNIAELEVDGL